MTSHLNINWGAVGDANRAAFKTTCAWALKYRPDSGLGKVAAELSTPFQPPAFDVRRDVHRHIAARNASTASLYPPLSVTAERTGASAATTSSDSSAKYATASPAPVAGAGAAVSAPSPASAGTADGASAASTRSHCHRKHRRNCPKHLLNERRRREECIAQGLPPPFSPVLEDGDERERTATANAMALSPSQSRTFAVGGTVARRLLALERRDDVGIPPGDAMVAVPRCVGRGFAVMLTGCCNADAGPYRERKLLQQHPSWDGQARRVAEHNARVLDPAYEHEAPYRAPLERKHFAKKDFVKTHAEHVQRFGKALLRDL